MDTRTARLLRLLAYAGLVALAAAGVVVVLILTGTPGWDVPMQMPKIGAK